MVGNRVECQKCGTHWQVLDENEAKLLVDTHTAMKDDHITVAHPTDLPVGKNLRELETACFMRVTNLLSMLE